ncbi:MAG: hypothetical protein ACRDNL_23550 [Spirillospora sp.]
MRRVRLGMPGGELLLAAVICAATAAVLIVWVVLAIVQIGGDEARASDVLGAVGEWLVGVTLATSGLLIIAHRTSPVVGWLLLTAALGTVVGWAAMTAVAVYPGNATAVLLATLVWIAGGAPQTVMMGVLPLLFPSGRLPHPRMRWYVAAVALWGVLQRFLPAAKRTTLFGVANPLGPAWLEEPVRDLHDLLSGPIYPEPRSPGVDRDGGDAPPVAPRRGPVAAADGRVRRAGLPVGGGLGDPLPAGARGVAPAVAAGRQRDALGHRRGIRVHP